MRIFHSMRRPFLFAAIVTVAATFALAAPAAASSHKGKGKPPKDEGPANPVIAFSAGREFPIDGIKVMDADGGNQTLVVSGAGRIDQPSWSPDGRFIAFYATQNLLECSDWAVVGLVELIDPATNTWGEPIPLVCKNVGTATPAFSPVHVGDTYTLAYFGRDGAVPLPGGRISEEIIVIIFDAPDGGPIAEVSRVNITNTPGISEIGPSWSPSADDIVVRARDVSADPDDPSTWVQDIVIYDAGGLGPQESLVQLNPAFAGMTIDSLDNPDWAKTSDGMILFSAEINGGDWDIWCVERGGGAAINVTQHLDDKEGAERADFSPSWLPDDSGFVFARNINKQLVELRFGNGYSPADGCPEASHLQSASETVLAQDKGRRKVGQPDYWRGALPPAP